MKKNLFIFIFLLFVLANLPNTGRAANSASKELIEFTFANKPGSYLSNELYVMKGDDVLLEEYRRGYKADSRHYAWSISKTISGTLIGAAVQRGDLSLQDPIEKYLGPIG